MADSVVFHTVLYCSLSSFTPLGYIRVHLSFLLQETAIRSVIIACHGTHNIRSEGNRMMGVCVILVREEEQLPVHRILRDRRKALPVQKTEWVTGLCLAALSGKLLGGASE